MPEIDFLGLTPKTRRDYDARARERTPEIVRVAKEFGREFFDGPRSHGYGGYRYDGRWLPVARRLCDHYRLAPDARVLDVGCAKGFLVHDLLLTEPAANVVGVDVSRYALEHAVEGTRSRLALASADALPFEDGFFDLVVSINSIHNLPPERCERSLLEIQRVSRGKSFISVDAWRTESEHENLLKWILTAETFMHVDEWKRIFDAVGFTGDYSWFIAD